MFRRADSERRDSLARLADRLRQLYRRSVAAAQQYMSASTRPESGTRVSRDPLMGSDFNFLYGQSCRSNVDGRKVEAHACVFGICMVLRLFNVVDVLRPAVKRQLAPSKPVIPITVLTNNSTNGRLCKEMSILVFCDFGRSV